MLVKTLPSVNSKTVCLLEFGLGHVECLYSQAAFLQSAGYSVVLIARRRFHERYRAFDVVNEFVWLDDGALEDCLTNQILYHLRMLSIDKLVINTFSGAVLKKLLTKLRQYRIAAIVHDLGSYNRSIWRKYLAFHVRCLFVLNDHLLYATPLGKRRQFNSFYPIFFPSYSLSKIEKNPDEIWICIPGQLELKRRDYGWLLNHLTADLNKRVRFILPGPSRHSHGDRDVFEQLAEKHGLNVKERFVLFDDFVPDELFHSYVAKSDLIMPLMFSTKRYFSSAISGALNLAFGYHIPLLTHKKALFIDDLAHHSIDYDSNNLIDKLNAICGDPSLLSPHRAGLQSATKFRFDYQRDRYIDALERTWRD